MELKQRESRCRATRAERDRLDAIRQQELPVRSREPMQVRVDALEVDALGVEIFVVLADPYIEHPAVVKEPRAEQIADDLFPLATGRESLADDLRLRLE